MSEVLDRSSPPKSAHDAPAVTPIEPRSEPVNEPTVSEAAPAVAVTVEPLSAQHFGQRLATHRQDMGLSQTEVAAQLRLHLRQVVALEAADFSGLPEVAFIRGYLRNYARILSLDEQPLLDDLHRRAQASLGEASTVPLSEDRSWMSTSNGSTRTLMREWLIARRLWLLGGAAALLALAVVGVVATREPEPTAAVESVFSAEAPLEMVTEPAAVGAVTAEAESSSKEAVQATAQPPLAVEPTLGAAPGPAQLRIVFKERSWAEVAQGDGRVVLSQVVEPGTRQFNGQPPYRVLIGNASGVNVQWRGRAVDLKSHTSFENVARLTLE